MITIIRIILCGTLFIAGCYSYTTYGTDKNGQLYIPENEYNQITLTNGAAIECEPLHHALVNTPLSFIYGVGSCSPDFTQDFFGRIDPCSIDSVTTSESKGALYRSYWLKTGMSIRYKEGDYLVVTPDKGTGILCSGWRSYGKTDSRFSGMVNFSDVHKIEARSNFTGIVLFVLGLGAAVFVMQLAADMGRI